MKKEDRNLLLKDLCARLPYGVIVEDRNGTHVLSIGNTEFTDLVGGKCNIKPYLRPMSSMTDEEKEELDELGLAYWDNGKHTDEDGYTIIYGEKEIQLIPSIETYDWLNANHFDTRELIGRNLAISTEVFNPYKDYLKGE